MKIQSELAMAYSKAFKVQGITTQNKSAQLDRLKAIINEKYSVVEVPSVQSKQDTFECIVFAGVAVTKTPFNAHTNHIIN